MISEVLVPHQTNLRTFVMVNVANVEVPGLGATFVLQLSKAAAPFIPATSLVFGEISGGWYYYEFTALECDTIGPLSVLVDGAGCVQQNLEYIIQQPTAGCTPFTYTVLSSITGLPVPGITVIISTDLARLNILWVGTSDAFGVARTAGGFLPCLTVGTYYFWKYGSGFTDDDSPDIEVV
jgi:hypothetical protein